MAARLFGAVPPSKVGELRNHISQGYVFLTSLVLIMLRWYCKDMPVYQTMMNKEAYLSFPHKPELEHITFPSTLQILISRIERLVVIFVLLKQIFGTLRVTGVEQVLVFQ